MADENEKTLKPKSFRIDDATADKIKEISNSIGGNQQQTMAKLIEAYEFQAGKMVLTEDKPQIDIFEKYVNAITRMYMGALEDKQNITGTVRAEFDALLKSKDAVIQDLQAQLSEAKLTKEDAMRRAQVLTEENEGLAEDLNTLRGEHESKMADYQTMLTDKDKVNKTLTELWEDTKKRLNEVREEIEEYEGIKSELAELKTNYMKEEEAKKRTENELVEYKQFYEAEKAAFEEIKEKAVEQCRQTMQAECDRALFNMEKSYQEQLQRVKEEKQAEVDKYQQKYMELLERIGKK